MSLFKLISIPERIRKFKEKRKLNKSKLDCEILSPLLIKNEERNIKNNNISSYETVKKSLNNCSSSKQCTNNDYDTTIIDDNLFSDSCDSYDSEIKHITNNTSNSNKYTSSLNRKTINGHSTSISRITPEICNESNEDDTNKIISEEIVMKQSSKDNKMIKTEAESNSPSSSTVSLYDLVHQHESESNNNNMSKTNYSKLLPERDSNTLLSKGRSSSVFGTIGRPLTANSSCSQFDKLENSLSVIAKEFMEQSHQASQSELSGNIDIDMVMRKRGNIGPMTSRDNNASTSQNITYRPGKQYRCTLSGMPENAIPMNPSSPINAPIPTGDDNSQKSELIDMANGRIWKPSGWLPEYLVNKDQSIIKKKTKKRKVKRVTRTKKEMGKTSDNDLSESKKSKTEKLKKSQAKRNMNKINSNDSPEHLNLSETEQIIGESCNTSNHKVTSDVHTKLLIGPGLTKETTRKDKTKNTVKKVNKCEGDAEVPVGSIATSATTKVGDQNGTDTGLSVLLRDVMSNIELQTKLLNHLMKRTDATNHDVSNAAPLKLKAQLEKVNKLRAQCHDDSDSMKTDVSLRTKQEIFASDYEFSERGKKPVTKGKETHCKSNKCFGCGNAIENEVNVSCEPSKISKKNDEGNKESKKTSRKKAAKGDQPVYQILLKLPKNAENSTAIEEVKICPENDHSVKKETKPKKKNKNILKEVSTIRNMLEAIEGALHGSKAGKSPLNTSAINNTISKVTEQSSSSISSAVSINYQDNLYSDVELVPSGKSKNANKESGYAVIRKPPENKIRRSSSRRHTETQVAHKSSIQGQYRSQNMNATSTNKKVQVNPLSIKHWNEKVVAPKIVHEKKTTPSSNGKSRRHSRDPGISDDGYTKIRRSRESTRCDGVQTENFSNRFCTSPQTRRKQYSTVKRTSGKQIRGDLMVEYR